MIQISGIDHIVLRTDKLSRMLHFYVDILGCPIERELPTLGLTQLRAGRALIDIVVIGSELGDAGGGAPGSTENNMDHFCLQIEPQSETAISQYLTEQGLQIGEFERRYGAEGYGRSLYLQDPENNTVELRCRQVTHGNT